jgi:hypothetical protein
LVLSRDEHDADGPVEAKVVEEVFVREGLVTNLTVNGRVIRTTFEHPFSVWNRGWVPCGELRVGDRIATESGAWVAVEGVEHTSVWAPVYNIRVADYHTDFVGQDDWGFSVWAHNADYSDAASMTEARTRFRTERGYYTASKTDKAAIQAQWVASESQVAAAQMWQYRARQFLDATFGIDPTAPHAPKPIYSADNGTPGQQAWRTAATTLRDLMLEALLAPVRIDSGGNPSPRQLAHDLVYGAEVLVRTDGSRELVVVPSHGGPIRNEIAAITSGFRNPDGSEVAVLPNVGAASFSRKAGLSLHHSEQWGLLVTDFMPSVAGIETIATTLKTCDGCSAVIKARVIPPFSRLRNRFRCGLQTHVGSILIPNQHTYLSK